MRKIPMMAAWVILAMTVTLASGCKKHAGDSCSGPTVLCQGDKRALVCVQGKLADVACFGPGGCIEAAHRCDTSKAEPGNACEGDWAACTGDGKNFLECKGNKLVQTATCGGPQGCRPFGQDLRCDQSQAKPGDMCFGKSVSCGADGKQMLRCDGTKFVDDHQCLGPKGCSAVAEKVSCDRSFAMAGDECEGSGGSCHVGGKELLECKGNKLVRSAFCRGKDGCTVTGSSLHCAQEQGAEGDPCDSGSGACSLDGKALLSCKNGKLAVSKKCKCTIVGTSVRCGR
jgi:hypothetical protein